MSDKEWDVFKESVKPIKKEGTAKTIIKKITPRTTSNQTTRTTADLETVLSKEWGNLEKNTHKKILKNQIKISNKLDLHGRSVEESKIAVFKFITNNFETQNRLLLIICGKGKRLGVTMGGKEQVSSTKKYLIGLIQRHYLIKFFGLTMLGPTKEEKVPILFI